MPVVGEKKTINGVEYEFGDNSRWNRISSRSTSSATRLKADVNSVKNDTAVALDNISAQEAMDYLLDGFDEGQRVDYTEAVNGHQERIALLEEELNKLIEEKDPDKLMEFAMTVASSEEYANIIHTLEEGKFAKDELCDEISVLTKNITDHVNNGKQLSINPDDIYPLSVKAKQGYEDFKGAGLLAEGYKNIIATGIFHSVENGAIDDYVEDIDVDNIGAAEKIGEFEPGSRAWLEARQNGFGCSDYGTLFATTAKRFDRDGVLVVDKYDPYRAEAIRELHDSKMLPISDEDVESQVAGQTIFTDPTSRGNAEEKFIAALAAQRLGIKVGVSKGTFNGGGFTNPNYDAQALDDNGVPIYPIEIKTASDPSHFGSEEEGIDGIPNNYRKQVLAEVYQQKADRGALAVLINEREFKVYQFDMTDELQAEAARDAKQADEIFSTLSSRKKAGKTNFDPAIYKMRTSGRGVPKGIPDSLLNTGMGAPKKRFFKKMVSNLNGESPDDILERLRDNLPADKKQWDKQTMEKAMVKTIHDSDVSNVTAVVKDTEVNSFNKKVGNIIEDAETVVNMSTGEIISSSGELFGLPPAIYDTLGTGAEEVHNITREMVKDKPLYGEENPNRTTDFIMENGGVMVAHNSQFEIGYYMSNEPKFAKAYANGDIRVVDTMDYARYTMPSAKTNKLEDFANNNGVAYRNAHRAEMDTQMTATALYHYFAGMHGGEAKYQ